MVATAPIGVLAFQGDFAKHLELLTDMGHETLPVRTVEDLHAISGLVIPGGESSTIGMLMQRFGLLEPLRRLVTEGMPVLGTCAGAILLAREIVGSNQPRLGLMDVSIERNAYGRQIESFEADIDMPAGGPADGTDSPHRTIRGVFIRAPIITKLGDGVELLASFEGNPVVIRRQNMIATTFHPELSGETALHEIAF